MDYWFGKDIVGFASFLMFIDSTPINHHPISLSASLEYISHYSQRREVGERSWLSETFLLFRGTHQRGLLPIGGILWVLMYA